MRTSVDLRHVACIACGAPLPITDEALRRGVVACGHCGVAQRVGPGTGALLARPGVVRVVERGVEREYVLPRLRTSIAINRRELVTGAAVGVVGLVVAAVAGLPWWTGLPVGVVVGLVGSAYLHTSLPPLRVTEDGLFGTSGFSAPVPRGEITQVYVACVRVGPAAEPFCSVWALMADGGRKHLAGPVQDMETALWVEQDLEILLGIATRDVLGQADVSTRGAEVDAPASQATPVLEARCAGCGAPVPWGPREGRRGFVVCRSCQGVTVVDAFGAGPMGAPEPTRAPQLDIRHHADGVTVALIESGARVEGTARGLGLDGSSGWVRPAAVVVRLRAVVDLGAMFERLSGRMAYSGAFDPTQDLADAADARFQLVAVMADGASVPLLAELWSVREASAAATALAHAAGLPVGGGA